MRSHHFEEIVEPIFWYFDFEVMSISIDFMDKKKFLCDDFINLFIEMFIFWEWANNLRSYVQIIGNDSFDHLISPLWILEWHQKVNQFSLIEVLKFDVFERRDIWK